MALYHVALLLGSDERKGYARIRELLAGPLKDDVAALRLILQELLHEDHRLAPDRTLTIAVAQRITELVKAQERAAGPRGQVSAFAWRDLALAHFKNGDATRSVEAQKHALELAEKHLGKNEKLLQSFREELAQYEAKKKGE